jgi:uncharacterized surface protein with fasciclin (FAS1) repeats
MMRSTLYILALLFCYSVFYSCQEREVEAGFEDQESMTIYDFLVSNEEEFSSFLNVLEAGGLDRTLSAYNPYGNGYTLFLPGNDAINEFINRNDKFHTLDDLLQDEDYCRDLGQYHVVLTSILSSEFPFGALPEYTMSGDLLTVNFIIEEDSSYYKINNQAPIIHPNIELSNGIVHVVKSALNPVNFTTYGWLEEHTEFSIFKSAVDATGLQTVLNINTRDETEESSPITLLVEPDSVYHKRGISDFNDLASVISPEEADYTNPLNPLYTFVAYHILTENNFLGDFEDERTNYGTYSDIPLLIDGKGLDILINRGKQVFDTIIDPPDTTVIDYIGFDYDASNIISQSGAIHIIDQIMKPQRPSRETITRAFWEERLLNTYRQEPGEYLIDDTSALRYINWYGADLIFVQKSTEETTAWNGDYLFLNGDFTISYIIPKIIQGRYRVILGAELLNRNNAVVEVFIDGKNLGGLVNLATGGSTGSPFAGKVLGNIDFARYEQHTIEIRVLIPGRLYWDYIRFEPN